MKFRKCLKTEGQVSAGLKAERLNSYGGAFCITFAVEGGWMDGMYVIAIFATFLILLSSYIVEIF
ncbi:unnamed protein product [Brugia timori]|uniref:Ion_trans_2 domain-containing protein n=2 Tax=Brugia TaxID=6278 RepID=A0A0R3R2P9_9BILA|nr:unnamed protein product [Brugia timori]